MTEINNENDEILEKLRSILNGASDETDDENLDVSIFSPKSIEILEYYIDNREKFESIVEDHDQHKEVVKILHDAYERDKRILDALFWVTDTTSRFGVIGKGLTKFMTWVTGFLLTYYAFQDNIKLIITNLLGTGT